MFFKPGTNWLNKIRPPMPSRRWSPPHWPSTRCLFGFGVGAAVSRRVKAFQSTRRICGVSIISTGGLKTPGLPPCDRRENSTHPKGRPERTEMSCEGGPHPRTKLIAPFTTANPPGPLTWLHGCPIGVLPPTLLGQRRGERGVHQKHLNKNPVKIRTSFREFNEMRPNRCY